MSFAAGAFSAGIRQDGHCAAQRRQFSVLNKNALSAAVASAAAAQTPGGVSPSPGIPAGAVSTAGAGGSADPRVHFSKQQSVIGGQLVDIQATAGAVAIDGAGLPDAGYSNLITF